MKINVLGLCSYPVESAATRYRLIQYIKPLAEREIDLTVSPFLNSRKFSGLYSHEKILSKAFGMLNPLKSRFFDLFSIRNFDILFVQRESMMFGPPVFEWLVKFAGKRPMILDLDDATYVRYISPTLGKMGSALKFFGKTDSLIDWSEIVVCGNRFIAEYVEKRGKKAVVLPTIVDTNIFCPVDKNNDVPVIGWIGTHSTFPFLQSLFPVFRELAEKHDFVLKIIGSGLDKIEIEGVKIENLKWNLERETEDFQSLDIGLYPLETSSSFGQEWILGKSGFKAIQYLSVGIPFVVTPIGVCTETGIDGETHFTASTKEQWQAALEKLLNSSVLRKSMGMKGRIHALENYTVARQAEKISAIFKETFENFHNKK